MRKCVLFNLHILICITVILFAGCGAKQITATTSEPPVFVDPDSVLSVIPGDSNGLIYIRNPLALNDEINALFAELVLGEPPQEVIAKTLADTFDAGFESLEELEELGLDLGKDFCVFFAGTKPLVPCAAVHVKDPEAIKLVIAAESDVGDTVEYNGTTYNITEDGGAFVILGDFLVYSGIPAVCEKAIDTHKKTLPSIGMNADYASLKLDPSLEPNDILAYFPMAPIVEMLAEAANGMKAGFAEMEAAVPDPAGLTMVSKMLDFGIQFIDRATTLSFTLQLNGTDLLLSPYLKFEEGSDAQKLFGSAPTPLTHLEYLPKTAAINSMMQFQKETWIDFTVGFMTMLAPADPNSDSEAIQQASQDFLESMSDFYVPLGEETSGAVNFSGSLMPDVVSIYDIVDEKQMATYMREDYLGQLAATMSMFKAIGAKDAANMYAGASAGPSEVYNDIEIMSISLPNISAGFSEMPAEMEGLLPKKWNNYYAINDEKLLISFATTAQPIKDALDRIAAVGTVAEDDMGHGKVIDTLTLKNNWIITLSPIALLDGVLGAVAQSSPEIGLFRMMFQNSPQGHSIGIAGQNRDGGVQVNIFIALADLKALINVGTTMQQAMQMQEMQQTQPMQ